MRFKYTFIAALVGLGTAWGQQEAGLTGPLLAFVPKGYSWQVTISPKVPAKPAVTPEQQAAEKERNFYRPQLVEIEVYKGDRDRSFIYTWKDGRKTDGVVINGVTYKISSPSYPNDVLVLDPNEPGSTAPDYAKTDFPELNWVKPNTYLRTITEEGRKALYCEGKGTSKDGDSDGKKKVWIDAETRRPIRYEDETNVYKFKFSSASIHEIKVPASLEKMVSYYGRKQGN